ncbi:MAG: adenosylmethionine decarboxylase [Hyphomicrobium sp.]
MAFNDALFQLGMDLTRSSTAQKEDHSVVASVLERNVREDKAEERNVVRFAGHHLIIDLIGAERLDDTKFIERTLKLVSGAAGGKVERVHLYRSAQGGVAGFAVLAEGHISVQTRPDTGFAAFDVLMTGEGKPQRTVEDLREAFSARDVSVRIVTRGSEAQPAWKGRAASLGLKALKGGKKAKAA